MKANIPYFRIVAFPAFVYLAWFSYLNQKPRNECNMTYMAPSYTPMGLKQLTNSQQYSLLLYIERTDGTQEEIDNTASGTPVIFVPGNSGSARQVILL